MMLLLLQCIRKFSSCHGDLLLLSFFRFSTGCRLIGVSWEEDAALQESLLCYIQYVFHRLPPYRTVPYSYCVPHWKLSFVVRVESFVFFVEKGHRTDFVPQLVMSTCLRYRYGTSWCLPVPAQARCFRPTDLEGVERRDWVIYLPSYLRKEQKLFIVLNGSIHRLRQCTVLASVKVARVNLLGVVGTC